jgi:DnaK suppressor protein
MVEKMEEMKGLLLKMKEDTLNEISKAVKSGSDVKSG